MSVDIVIPMRDAAATLEATLDAVAMVELDEPPAVIVVDDGSSDGSARIAREHRLRPLVIEGPRTGAGAARNAGARAGTSDAIAFTDADCQPEPGWLREALPALATCGLVQGAVLPKAGVAVGPWDRTLAVVDDWGLFEAANLLVQRTVFEALGGFQEHPDAGARAGGRPFGEDADFGWRARRAGVVIRFRREAVVRHEVFRRGPRAYVQERRRDGLFCGLVKRVPELRDDFLYRRWFLNQRTARFDLMLIAVISASVRRRPLPLIAALPYAATVRGDRRRTRLVLMCADVVGGWSLVKSSVATRSLVL